MSDVARAAHVSTMTVSRVLNGNSGVSEETRRRVFAAVDKLRYRRNELARSLRERRTRQIGIVVPNLLDPFFANCVHAIGVVAREHDYSISVALSHEDPNIEFEEAGRMFDRSVEGFVVIPAASLAQASRLDALQISGVPLVTADRIVSTAGCDSVMVENSKGARLATEHLLALGHKSVACISLHESASTTTQRQQGYRRAMTDAGLKPDIRVVGESPEGMLALMQVLIASKQAPTAVFCTNNLLTRNFLHATRLLSGSSARPLALVGFDDFETADLLHPGVTVVRQPVEQLGRTAAEALFQRLENPERKHTPRQIVLPVELVVRGSCGGKPRTIRA